MATNLLDWLRQSLSGQSDCEKCLELLELILDGEASPEEEKLFRKHIQDCLPCYESYNLETSIKQILQTKLEKKQVPDDLIARIRSKIRNTA